MRRLLVIGMLLLALTGCGTVRNLQRDPPGATTYGGVEIATARFDAAPRNDPAPILTQTLNGADVALSAIGDTLVLPITLAHDLVRTLYAYNPAPEKPQ